jgi:anti-sigma B factor antagonist
MDPHECLEVATVGDVTVARFTREVVLAGPLAEEVGDRLGALLAGPKLPRLVIDFANVRSLSSLMLAKLVALNRAAEAAAGRLALCNLRPDVRELMKVTRLNMILRIYEGEQEARDGV